MGVNDDPDEAFAAARDTTKQLITLATSILTVTITFHREAAPVATLDAGILLLAASIGYAVSVGFGIVELMTLTAELGQSGHAPTLASWAVRRPALLQMVTFGAATGMIVSFGSRALLAQP